MTLDAKEGKLTTRDDSKVLLAEIPQVDEKFGKASKDSGENKDVEEIDEHLNADEIKVQFCNGQESVTSGKANLHSSANDHIDMAWTPSMDNETEGATGMRMNQYDNPPKLKAVTSQSSDYKDGPYDDEFAAKDLLSFAWQIARGMVSS